MSLVLSIDVGTSNIKASLVTPEGHLVKIVRRAQNIIRTEDRAAEHCPHELLKLVLEISKEAVVGHEADVRLVVMSTYQYGLVVLDQSFQPVSKMSTLLDTRSRRSYQDFLTNTDASQIYLETGCPSYMQSILPRLFYFKQNNPELLKAGYYYLSSKAWLLYCFTGELISEASTESPSQFLNIKNQTWSQGILDLVGLKTSQLPEILEPNQESFPIKKEIRQLLGVSADCQIIAGVYDGGAICLGMNCLQPARAVSNIGTSGMLRVLSDRLVLDDSKLMRYQPFYLMEGKYLIGGATNNAALALKWIKENLLNLDYQQIDRLAHDSPVGSRNLFFMPYLTGERDINIGSICSASFFGLREYHQQADFIRSVLEGVSFNLNLIKESLTESGIQIGEVQIGGGGVHQADIWVDILANVLNLRLCRSQNEEPCLIGNAILGFTYLREFPTLEDAGNKMTKIGAIAEPNPSIVEEYKKQFQFFKTLYQSFIPLYQMHANFSRGHSKL